IVRSAGEAQVDLAPFEKALKALDGGVVAAGVIADADLDARQILRPLIRRLGCNKDARWTERVRMAVHAAVTGGRGSIDRPVTGRADVACATLRHVLESAALNDRYFVGRVHG